LRESPTRSSDELREVRVEHLSDVLLKQALKRPKRDLLGLVCSERMRLTI
jgi:hypothetical protein